jgi:hypothetical protein
LDLIVDVQLYNPGNPLFVTLKIDPLDLKEYYRHFLKGKLERNENLVDVVFYLNKIPVGYFFGYNA